MFPRARLSRVQGRDVFRSYSWPVFPSPCSPRVGNPSPSTIFEPISVRRVAFEKSARSPWKNRTRVCPGRIGSNSKHRLRERERRKSGRRTQTRETTAGLRSSDSTIRWFQCACLGHTFQTRKKLIADVWWIATRTPWTESYSVFPRSSLPAAASLPYSPRPARSFLRSSTARRTKTSTLMDARAHRPRCVRCVLSSVSPNRLSSFLKIKRVPSIFLECDFRAGFRVLLFYFARLWDIVEYKGIAIGVVGLGYPISFSRFMRK